MNPIGGEIYLKSIEENIYFTDSGRSSLRLFIRSGNHNKKFLIPNYFCEIIELVLIEEKINYQFYNILPNLSIDEDSIVDKEFDVLYIINYFGKVQIVNKLNLKNKIVIEDNVFFYRFENYQNYQNWFAFNSFRKISPLADGSMIKTNISLNKALICSKEADFVKIKYDAKNEKYLAIKKKNKNDLKYLKLFNNAENLLNNQKKIYSISNRSIMEMSKFNFKKAQYKSKKYFEIIEKHFFNMIINKNIKEYSFLVINVEKRDLLRNYLFNKDIFLAQHWPESTQKNELYNNVISIPLFFIYSEIEINYILNTIKEFYEINR